MFLKINYIHSHLHSPFKVKAYIRIVKHIKESKKNPIFHINLTKDITYTSPEDCVGMHNAKAAKSLTLFNQLWQLLEFPLYAYFITNRVKLVEQGGTCNHKTKFHICDLRKIGLSVLFPNI